jgi:large subunit ribosomal protein L35
LAKVKVVKLKLKTRKAAAKRFKLTAGGKIIRGHAYARHILTSKDSKRKRKLDQSATVSPADAARVRAMLPYGRS